jgi:hypothetical protein
MRITARTPQFATFVTYCIVRDNIGLAIVAASARQLFHAVHDRQGLGSSSWIAAGTPCIDDGIENHCIGRYAFIARVQESFQNSFSLLGSFRSPFGLCPAVDHGSVRVNRRLQIAGHSFEAIQNLLGSHRSFPCPLLSPRIHNNIGSDRSHSKRGVVLRLLDQIKENTFRLFGRSRVKPRLICVGLRSRLGRHSVEVRRGTGGG